MSLKSAADHLENSFKEAEAKLDKVAESVDQTVLHANSDSGKGPSELLQSLKEIKAEHNSIVKQVEELQISQKAFVDQILKDLTQLKEAEDRLVTKIGGEGILKKD